MTLVSFFSSEFSPLLPPLSNVLHRILFIPSILFHFIPNSFLDGPKPTPRQTCLSRLVPHCSFHIEYIGELNGRRKHSLIYYDTHRFKQLKEIDVLSGKAKDLTISSVYECSHANKTGCPCKFILREDQSGEVVGEHTHDQKNT